MNGPSVSIVGLPGSGKTTFLAALWHLLTEGDLDTELRLKDLHAGSTAYLNDIASRWRQALIQERTQQTGDKSIKINLVSRDGDRTIRVNFPDVAGEKYSDMWENRTCAPDVMETLDCKNVLLFVNANTVRRPTWIADEAELLKQMDLPPIEEDVISWAPKMAPTQVQVVDLLQILTDYPFFSTRRNLNVMLSAWDQVEAEGLSPVEYLDKRLPLLSQYLSNSAPMWNTTINGISAQGGQYDDPKEPDEKSQDADRLRKMDEPSSRIRFITAGNETEDLTLPFAKLLE